MAFRSSSHTGSGNDVVASHPVPTGAAANDIAVVSFYLQSAAAVTPPSGFTLKSDIDVGSHHALTYWKRLTGADSGTYDFTWSGSAYREGVCALFSGRITSGDPFESFGTNTASSTTNTVTALSPAASGDDLVGTCTNFNGGAWTPPSGMTEREDQGVVITLDTADNVASGSTGNKTFTCGSSGDMGAFLGALLPVGGGGSVTPADPVGITDSVALATSPEPIPVAFVAAGAWDAPATVTTTSPAYPAGLAEFDICYAVLVVKPDTATVTTPANWTLVGTSGSIAGGTAGAGVGPIKVHVYKRVVPSGGLTGTQSFTVGTSPSSVVSQIVAFRYDATGHTSPAWDAETFTQFSRTTGSTTYGGTGAADIALGPQDVMLYVSAASDDQPTTHYSTGPTFSATGATFTGPTAIGTEGANAAGNDVSGHNAYVLLTTGSGISTAAPVSTHTGSSSETGGGMFIRVSAMAATSAALTGSPSDAVGVTDSASQIIDAVRTPADPVGVLDTVALDATRTSADPVGITDSATANLTGGNTTVTPADPVGLADAVTVDRATAAADPVGLTDVVLVARSTTVADPVGLTDTALAGRDLTASVTDSVAILDTDVTQTLDEVQGVDDPVGVTDAATRVMSAARAPADPVGITDSATGSLVTAGSATVNDPLGITDAASRILDATRTQPDPVGLTDAVLAQLDRVVTVADFLNLTDSAGSAGAGSANLTDPAGISDSTSWGVDRPRPVGDTFGLTDSVVAVLDRVVTLADPVGATDAATSVRAGANDGLPVTNPRLTLTMADSRLTLTTPSSTLELST